MPGVRFQISQQLGARVEAGDFDDVLGNDTDLGVGAAAMRCAEEDDGIR